MSILIKGMEMPKGRPVCIVIDAAGQARRYDLNNDRYADDELFEAVSVPPHGRLIDADALCDQQDKLAKCSTGYVKDRTYEMMVILQTAPTIIPASEEGE